MYRKIISAILLLVLCCALAVAASAEAIVARFVYDEADLLTDSQEAALEQRLVGISKAYNAQVVVATVSSVDGGDVDAFVEYFYDSKDFGYGEDHDGVLLLVSMDPREYRILSNGFAADAITMGRIDAIGEAIASDLSDGDYDEAFDTFADKCEYYLDGHINGFPFKFGKNLLIALVIGLLVGAIVASALKGQLKSVHKRNDADVYVKPGSMQITISRDLFLYRNVTRTKRQTSSSGTRSSGGGGSRNVGGGSF